MLGRRKESAAVLGPGDTLGDYLLAEPLGEGGMGQVFRATRSADSSTVALKVMKAKFASDETYTRRFLREARAAAEVDHPNLVKVLDAGEVDGHHFLAMNLVPGESLEQRIDRERGLPVADIVRIVGEVAGALDALHRVKLIHRDIKAGNVLLDTDGQALLTDFGLAKGEGYSNLTKPGQVMGTLDYISPELIRGEPASAASDVYALGCVVYESLAGTPPYGGKSIYQVGMAILEEAPPDPCADRPDVPADFSGVVLRALEKDPAARPPSATAYANLLRMASAPTSPQDRP